MLHRRRERAAQIVGPFDRPLSECRKPSGVFRFETEAGFPVHLTNVSDVSAGRRGSDKANTWIEVHGEVESKPTVVFVTDATWYGWRPILSRSNEEIAKALAKLEATAPLSEPR